MARSRSVSRYACFKAGRGGGPGSGFEIWLSQRPERSSFAAGVGGVGAGKGAWDRLRSRSKARMRRSATPPAIAASGARCPAGSGTSSAAGREGDAARGGGAAAGGGAGGGGGGGRRMGAGGRRLRRQGGHGRAGSRIRRPRPLEGAMAPQALLRRD